MREEDSNWFSKWEDELPSPEDLIPLSQSLITPDIALAFNITTSHHAPPLPQPRLLPMVDLESPDGGPSGGSASDEQMRTAKRPRLVWTPQLHKRFVDAVAHLGIKNAVPKTIMQLMSVDGLTRENVASHLQKYRLYLKRMQGIPNGGGGVGNLAAAVGMDPATDHLFASSPVPPHFLHPSRGNSDHYLPFVPIPPHQHHSQIRASSPASAPQLQFHHFGNSPPTGHPNLKQSLAQTHRLSTSVHDGKVEDLESATPRKALTLFPTGDDLS